MNARGSTWAGAFVAALALVLVGEAAHRVLRGDDAARIATARELVAGADLTDLALFGEARYTRHRALADLHSAFQDGPMSFEHFPAGSMIAPPRDVPGGLLSDRAPADAEAKP